MSLLFVVLQLFCQLCAIIMQFLVCLRTDYGTQHSPRSHQNSSHLDQFWRHHSSLNNNDNIHEMGRTGHYVDLPLLGLTVSSTIVAAIYGTPFEFHRVKLAFASRLSPCLSAHDLLAFSSRHTQIKGFESGWEAYKEEPNWPTIHATNLKKWWFDLSPRLRIIWRILREHSQYQFRMI